MSNRQERIWVDPSFRKMLKSIAAQEDISILELTKKIGEKPDEFSMKKDGKKRTIFELTFP